MNIIPWRKTKEKEETTDLARSFNELQKEMNCLFENFFGETRGELPVSGFTPLVDITETDEQIVVKADLPGLLEKDIDVTIDEDALILKGEKTEETEDTRKGVYRLERSYGAFYRRIPLPVEVDTEKVEATFDRGVLTVNLPKREAVKTAGIKVNVKTA